MGQLCEPYIHDTVPYTISMASVLGLLTIIYWEFNTGHFFSMPARGVTASDDGVPGTRREEWK